MLGHSNNPSILSTVSNLFLDKWSVYKFEFGDKFSINES